MGKYKRAGETSRKTRVKMHKSGKNWVRTLISAGVSPKRKLMLMFMNKKIFLQVLS